MEFDFRPLQDTLRRVRASSLDVEIWWRDDDLIEPTPKLDRLLALADASGVPVHVAIIPKDVDSALPHRLPATTAVPMVHGWVHQDHSLPKAKKSEFGHPREDAAEDLRRGMTRLTDMFPNLAPVFVPPWNRIDPGLFPHLVQLGFRGLSTFGNRPQKYAAKDLLQVNTHIDPIFWKDTRDLVPPDQLIAQTTACLEARLEGRADVFEPLGLLTHHLVHTEAVWRFSQQWLCEMLDGGSLIKANILET